jgi:dTDP-4-amino-4,6-dideoxygalactose transaminase
MIPLFRVKMADDVPEAVSRTLTSGFVTQGPRVDEFEEKLCSKFDHPYILTLNSATAGLTLAVRLLEAPSTNWPGFDASTDVVLSTPLTCTATNFAIMANRYSIKWVDTDPETCNMDLVDLEKQLDHTTKIIMIVHWGGTPLDLRKLDEILDRKAPELGFRPRVIEDCAHAFGSKLDGRSIGTWNNIAVFSLQAIKHMTCGDGGLIFLPNEELYERAKLLRWYGIDRNRRNYDNKDFRLEKDVSEWGYKFHMNDINATIGLVNLGHIDETVAAHTRNGQLITEGLKGLKNVSVLKEPPNCESAYWIYTLKVRGQATEFIDFMKEHEITASQVHRRNDIHSCLADFKRPLPQLDALEDHYVCVPCGWWLSDSDFDRIIQTIKDYDNMPSPCPLA